MTLSIYGWAHRLRASLEKLLSRIEFKPDSKSSIGKGRRSSPDMYRMSPITFRIQLMEKSLPVPPWVERPLSSSQEILHECEAQSVSPEK